VKHSHTNYFYEQTNGLRLFPLIYDFLKFEKCQQNANHFTLTFGFIFVVIIGGEKIPLGFRA